MCDDEDLKVIVMPYNTPLELIKNKTLRKYQILTQEEHKEIVRKYLRQKQK